MSGEYLTLKIPQSPPIMLFPAIATRGLRGAAGGQTPVSVKSEFWLQPSLARIQTDFPGTCSFLGCFCLSHHPTGWIPPALTNQENPREQDNEVLGGVCAFWYKIGTTNLLFPLLKY